MLWKTWEVVKSQRKEVEKERGNCMSGTVMERWQWLSRRLLSYFPDIDKDLSDWLVRTKEQQRICIWNGRRLRLEVLVWIFYSLPLITHPTPSSPLPCHSPSPSPKVFPFSLLVLSRYLLSCLTESSGTCKLQFKEAALAFSAYLCSFNSASVDLSL